MIGQRVAFYPSGSTVELVGRLAFLTGGVALVEVAPGELWTARADRIDYL